MIRLLAPPPPSLIFRALATILALSAGMAPALASPPKSEIRRGRIFAQDNCARCHAIGATGDSPLKEAPPFRVLHRNYPIEQLEEAFAEGIVTGHAAMPEFQLDERQSRALIAYIKSLDQ